MTWSRGVTAVAGDQVLPPSQEAVRAKLPLVPMGSRAVLEAGRTEMQQPTFSAVSVVHGRRPLSHHSPTPRTSSRSTTPLRAAAPTIRQMVFGMSGEPGARSVSVVDDVYQFATLYLRWSALCFYLGCHCYRSCCPWS